MKHRFTSHITAEPLICCC